MKRSVLAAALLLCCIGCSSQPASLISATSPLPPGVRGTIPTHGSDCQFRILFGIIPITSSPDTQAALNEAKKRADVDVLTDVTVDRNSGWYILFANSCVKVRGMGVPRDMIADINRRSSEPAVENPEGGFLD